MTGPRWAALACARLLRAALAVAIVAALGWCFVEVAPGSTAERAARAAGLLPADTIELSPAEKAAVMAPVAQRHRLDRPLPNRIAAYVAGLPAGDLGTSWRDGSAVARRVQPASGTTLVLVLSSLAVAVAFGIGFGALAAERPGSRLDVAVAAASAVAISIPLAWLGMLVLHTFASGHPFRWFSLAGPGVLPVLTLAVIPAAVIARHARAALVEAARQPWAIAARARGASTRRVIAVHALSVTAPSLLALLPALVGYALGASLVVERVFGIRGLGWLITDASARGDAPVVVGASVVAAAILGLASAGTDLVSRAIDPREAPREAGDA